MATLLEQALTWRDQDPDPATVARLDELLARAESHDEAATAELVSAFAGPITFGTAGLRAALGPGPARMNRVVVSQAAAGLAAHLTKTGHAGERVIIGYDARHNSEIFARDTAEILAGAGLRPLLCAEALPTPVAVFGIKHFRCAAAVVVTASHNPAQDNGYKVYLGDGSQIVSPHEAEIAAEIAAVAARGLGSVARSQAYDWLGGELVEAYVARASTLVDEHSPREVNWVYTAMHGVGAATLERVVAATGFPQPRRVIEQLQPDPDFPTLPFPNPEEAGAIDLAIDLARRTDADIAIANDPDADRCALAAVIGGDWRMLTGDELGALLAFSSLTSGIRGTYACSVVSSTLLAKMAADFGQPFRTTLTGFKWIARVPNLVFGYEEAIGYCTDPSAVADKDGITALLRVLAVVAALKAAGRTVADLLEEITARYGTHLTSQLSFRVSDLFLITRAMQALRTQPPAVLAGESVTMSDLAEGSAELPPTEALLFTGESLRVVVRPSGTEPKLKCYLQVAPTAAAGHSSEVTRVAAERMERLRADLAAALRL